MRGCAPSRSRVRRTVPSCVRRRAARASSVSANVGMGGSGVERSTGSGPQLQRSRPKTIRSDIPGPRRGSCGFFTVLPAASFAQYPRGGRSKSARRQAFAKPTSKSPTAWLSYGSAQTRRDQIGPDDKTCAACPAPARSIGSLQRRLHGKNRRAWGWPSRSNLHRNEVDLAVKAAGHAVRAQPPLACR